MEHHQFFDRRQLLSLALFALALFLLAPQFIGLERLAHLIRSAEPVFLALALAAETMRYLLSAGTTAILARLFDRRVPYTPLAQAFFASAAANRTFSLGGAPGMLLRLIFLTRQGVSAGAVAVIYLIEDIAGVVIGGLILLTGIVALAATQPSTGITNALITFVLTVTLLGGATFYALRYRANVERGAHWLARQSDALIQHVAHRSLLPPTRVQHTLDDFYIGLAAARRKPAAVAVVFGFNFIRHLAGIATLYFTFGALGQTLAPGVLLLMYTTANLLSATSAAPGEVAIMGSGLAILSLTLGIAPDLAILALLLSRAIAFWFPLPVGWLAFWHLRRRHYL